MAISFKDKIAYVNKYAPKDNDKVQKLIKLAVNIDSQKLNLNPDQKAKLKDGVEKAFAQIKTKRESSQATPSAPAKKRGRPKGSTKASKAQKSSGALKDFKKKIGRKLYAKATTGTRIDIDMERPAVKPGKRIVRKKGQTSNQYGTFSNKVGRKYWENRANRMDINQPSKTRYPKLAKGGEFGQGGQVSQYRIVPYKNTGGANSDLIEAIYAEAFSFSGSLADANKEAQQFLNKNDMYLSATITKIHPSGQPLKNKIVTEVTKDKITKLEDGGEFGGGGLTSKEQKIFWWINAPEKVRNEAIEYWSNRKKLWNNKEITLSKSEIKALTTVQKIVHENFPEKDHLFHSKLADGGEFGGGGFVSKGEMVWKKLSLNQKRDFLYENFTPQITPRSQEIVSQKAYNFLPKNVKIAWEAKYANVESYADGGNIQVLSNSTVNEIRESAKMGYNIVQVGMISPKKRGVVLMNEDYQVRGTYPLEYKEFIEKIVEGKLANGGSIAKGNYEMVLSKAKELHHHASELQDALKKEKNIEAWVVAKVQRASQDLSDVTHYLDGMSEYGEGGKVEGNYVAVGEKDGYWTIITKPTTKEKAQQMIDMGSLPKDEVGKVVTVQEAKDHKKVIGREYLAQGGTLAGNLDVDNIGFGLMAKGGMTMQAIADKYEKNEDDNAHSENVVLLAKHFGTAEELKEAKAILKKHNEEGSLSTENGAKRRDLHLKLIAKARKEMMQEGVNFAKGGRLIGKQRNLDMNNNGKLDKEDFQIIRSGKRIVRKNKK